VKKFGVLSIVSCIALCVSTATISDGGDMNWTVHTIGATSFFIFALYMVLVASKIYRELYAQKHFISSWSYQIKKYSNEIVGFFLLIELLMGLKLMDWGSFVEWAAAFYIMIFFLTLYWDFKDMDIMMIRK
jgi:c-di-AMP phosphodiesterase-like protein